ncbi:acyl carrier protein [Columbia Basin potato purple top phytoplasma]|uniref:Acyl carrier protein n=1 Tax=Columbia Basin potato purple top phytoplasma TaxID=307134 RepID=A0ABT5L8L3_9MOLU|nr:acyl carrier protein [Columbia Basin potato purple top phytoplasma]MDC9031991.1 acyl carrier protein [Columbia Basin potato purple top phytoplasma]
MVLDKIKEIISTKKHLNKDQISLDKRLKEDLNLDSFSAVEIVIELENSFDLKISDEVMQQFKTVKDVVEYIESNLS